MSSTRISPLTKRWSRRAVGNPFGIAGHGRAVRFRLVHIFEFRDGLIARENA